MGLNIGGKYPTSRPSINWDFANAGSLPPGIEFDRSTVATYLDRDGFIKTAKANEPRFDHDPTTLEPLGLLKEDARTNYLDNTALISGWTTGVAGDTFIDSLGVSEQQEKAPDGSSAYYYKPSTTPGYHRYYRSVTVPTLDTTYVVSIFAKRVLDGSVSNLNRYLEIEVTGNFNANTQGTGHTGTTGGSAVTFDLQDEEIEVVADKSWGYVGNARMVKYPNGWYRLSYCFNPGIGTDFTGQVWFGHPATLGSDNGSETGNGNPSFYMWGANIQNVVAEDECFSYIVGGTTRQKDNLIARNPDFTFPATIVTEFTTLTRKYARRLYGINPESGSDTIRPYISDNGSMGYYTTYGTVATDDVSTGANAAGSALLRETTTGDCSKHFYGPTKHAWAIGFGDTENAEGFKLCCNGIMQNSGNAIASTLHGTHKNISYVKIGYSSQGDTPREWCGHYKSIRIYSNYLGNDSMISLTKDYNFAGT